MRAAPAIWRRAFLARIHDDDGSTMPLIIGLVALCLAVVLVATAATSLVTARMRLLSLADGAALAAAEGFTLGDLRVVDGALRADLTDAAALAAAAAAIAATPVDGLESVELVAASAPDGRSAVVTVAAMWRPPLPIWLVPNGLPLQATSTARVVIR